MNKGEKIVKKKKEARRKSKKQNRARKKVDWDRKEAVGQCLREMESAQAGQVNYTCHILTVRRHLSLPFNTPKSSSRSSASLSSAAVPNKHRPSEPAA